MFFAFQASSADLRLTTNPQSKITAICNGEHILVETLDNGTIKLGIPQGCPQGESKPIAVVDTESSGFLYLGLFCIVISLLWQICILDTEQRRKKESRQVHRFEERHT